VQGVNALHVIAV